MAVLTKQAFLQEVIAVNTTITTIDYYSKIFIASGLSANITLTLPAAGGGAANGVLIRAENKDTTYSLLVTYDTGKTVTLEPGQTTEYIFNGTKWIEREFFQTLNINNNFKIDDTGAVNVNGIATKWVDSNGSSWVASNAEIISGIVKLKTTGTSTAIKVDVAGIVSIFKYTGTAADTIYEEGIANNWVDGNFSTAELTATGNIIIDKSDPIIQLKSGSAETTSIEHYDDGVKRWANYKDLNNQFTIARFNSLGVIQDRPILIDQTTGHLIGDHLKAGTYTFTYGTHENVSGVSATIRKVFKVNDHYIVFFNFSGTVTTSGNPTRLKFRITGITISNGSGAANGYFSGVDQSFRAGVISGEIDIYSPSINSNGALNGACIIGIYE